jgi:hypothetical protein
MNQAKISAGGNLTIELQPEMWRLLINGSGAERVLVEAESGFPIRYAASFGAQRRLPESTLPTDYVQRVVVGWSGRDEAWHLGLMLEPSIAETRGSRWCEIAHWPDPDANLYADIATQAGEGLAQHIKRPFNFVPPKPAEERAAYVASLTAPPLAPLPLKFDQWTLTQPTPAILSFTLASSWGRGKLFRTVWYTFWAAVFILLSVTSLTSGIALPRMGTLTITLPNQPEVTVTLPPETLVYAGFACAALLVLLAISSFLRAATAVKRIEVDGELREVRGMRGRRTIKWRIPASALDSVYASQIVSRFNPRRSDEGRTVNYGELLLYLKEGAFKHIVATHNFEDKLPVKPRLSEIGEVNIDVSNEDSVTPLTAHDAHTPLQAAALYVARTLDLPARYDQRVK